ncbi:MAG: hypothetical protein Q8R15_03415 [Candidatus Micrarchaeota archaeon]|nr:hypothetical protein [Candidatus Micrarchaeota archaeon]
MDEVEQIIQNAPEEAREKSRSFIVNHGIDAFKKIRTLEVFNLEEAWQALKDCSNEELLLVRMLIRDTYGMSLQEIADKLKETGAEKTRAAFFKLKSEKKRFTAADVFSTAANTA